MQVYLHMVPPNAIRISFGAPSRNPRPRGVQWPDFRKAWIRGARLLGLSRLNDRASPNSVRMYSSRLFERELEAGKRVGTPQRVPVALLIQPAVGGNAPDLAFRL
jgi:hypothetical protein